MTIIEAIVLASACLASNVPLEICWSVDAPGSAVAPNHRLAEPVHTGESVDVVLTAEAALAWDVATEATLYTKNATLRRPVASLTKLLSVLVAAEKLPLDRAVIISPTAARQAWRGADIQLPAGHHARVDDLLAAALIPSANDAMVALAEAVAGTEDLFVQQMNAFAQTHQLTDTKAANATGLAGGEQYSTARDVQRLMIMAYEQPTLQPLLRQPRGSLRTTEGVVRNYVSTNKLLATYVPIVAAKTGFTTAAGENLVVITRGSSKQLIGAIILGSTQRFQDMKVLLEWIDRNYSWP